VNVDFYDFRRRLNLERDEIHRAVDTVIELGSLVLGPSVEEFEREFSELFGFEGTVAVANGTDALEIAIRALMPPGATRVVTVANAGAYAAIAAARAGYAPFYWDVDPESLLMDLESLVSRLDELVSRGCGVVVFTHLYGSSTDLTTLKNRCDDLGIGLIEDCAQSVGASSPSGAVGGMGHAGTFSFFPTKNLGAFGDAGAIASLSGEVLARVRALRQYGWEAKYQIVEPGGRNSRMDAVQAEYLRAKLARLGKVSRRRREILEAYLKAAPGIRFVSTLQEGHVAHLAVLQAKNRDTLKVFLERRGVQTAIHYPHPDFLQNGIARPVSLPHTAHACDTVLSLPCNEFMTDDEVIAVCEGIEQWQ